MRKGDLPMTAEATATESVAREILAYLNKRPQACDTLDGILQWWLPRIRLEEATETVEQALVLLERRHLVDRVATVPGPVMYRRRLHEPDVAVHKKAPARRDQRNTR
jgi:hypothetical protein